MEIDYLLLADHAEVTGGKLYLMGGGWDTRTVADVPVNVRVMVAAGIRVDWDQTNTVIPLVLRVDDDDAQEMLRINGQMNIGRPPTLLPGTSQLSQMTFAIQAQFKQLGGYRITLMAGTGETEIRRSIPFKLAKSTR